MIVVFVLSYLGAFLLGSVVMAILTYLYFLQLEAADEAQTTALQQNPADAVEDNPILTKIHSQR